MRENGLYWVEIHKEWTIGDFDSNMNSWLIVGSDESFKDEDFDTIGKQIKQDVE